MRPEDLPASAVLDLLEKQLARYQAIITRLANNSVQVKTWCVTALGALVALAANGDKPSLLLVGLAVLTAFFALDAYYLALERHFRDESGRVVDALAADTLPSWTALAKVEGPKLGARQWRAVAASGSSLAVSPFYVGLAALLAVGLLLTL